MLFTSTVCMWHWSDVIRWLHFMLFSHHFYTPRQKSGGGYYVIPSKQLWVSLRPSVSASFPDSNLSSFWSIFFKLCMDIDIGEEWVGIANGINLFINNRVMALDWCKNAFFLNIFRTYGWISIKFCIWSKIHCPAISVTSRDNWFLILKMRFFPLTAVVHWHIVHWCVLKNIVYECINRKKLLKLPYLWTQMVTFLGGWLFWIYRVSTQIKIHKQYKLWGLQLHPEKNTTIVLELCVADFLMKFLFSFLHFVR